MFGSSSPGDEKLCPERRSRAEGGSERKTTKLLRVFGPAAQGRHQSFPRTLFDGLGGKITEIRTKVQLSDGCLGVAAHGLISCSPESIDCATQAGRRVGEQRKNA